MREQTIEAATTGRVTVGAIPASAVITALAGVLVALGSIGTWATIRAPGQGDTLLSGAVAGLDMSEGKVTLAFGMGLVAVAAALLLRSAGWRRVLPLVLLLASLAAGTIAAVDALRADERFRAARMDQVARNISDTTGFPFDPIRARLASQTAGPAEVTLGGGMALVLAGAVLGAGTSAVMMAGSGRRSARAG